MMPGIRERYHPLLLDDWARHIERSESLGYDPGTFGSFKVGWDACYERMTEYDKEAVTVLHLIEAHVESFKYIAALARRLSRQKQPTPPQPQP